MLEDVQGADPLERHPQILHLVRSVANQVHDPCSMAMGLKIGLDDMGLVREVNATRAPNGWDVRLLLRLTSPGCQYFFYFREELEKRLLAYASVSTVRVEWDERLDWTPDDFSATAREKIAERTLSLYRARTYSGWASSETAAGVVSGKE